MSYCRQNTASEMLNACPPRETEYHGVVPQDQSSQSVSYGDPSIHRDHSQLAGLQQEGYSNGSGQRWSVTGQEGSPKASFRSHYSGFDERGLVDDMMWHSREEVRAFILWIALHGCVLMQVFVDLFSCVINFSISMLVLCHSVIIIAVCLSLCILMIRKNIITFENCSVLCYCLLTVIRAVVKAELRCVCTCVFVCFPQLWLFCLS